MAAKKTSPVANFPAVWYDDRKSVYWLPVNGCEFMEASSRDVKLHAKHAGFPSDFQDGDMTKSERELVKAQIHRRVRWAGPLAGHKAGCLTLPDGSRIVVTRQVQPVAPQDVPFPFLEKYLDELFGPEQLHYIFAWLKLSHDCLSQYKFQPGQMLALGGPANCGKSLFHYVVTKFLGGRSAKPYRYMSGQTTFNGDLATAEHLYIEDEDASYDIRSRRKFGTAIKDFVVNEFLSIHDKGYQAITLPFWRRLTCSFNDEAENIMILPPMDESVSDKIMLFKCGRASVHLDREKNREIIDRELPGLAHFVRNEYKIAAGHREKDGHRFGVRAWHHPDLLAALSDMSQESQLLSIIEENLFGDDDCWRGTAEKLTQELIGSKSAFTAQKIFSFPSACGTYLSRLMVKFPDRFSKVKNTGRTVWTIQKTKG